jgi:hypothetical protein
LIALIGAALASRKAHLGDARNQDRAPNDAGELGWELRPIGRNELEEYQPRGDRIGWVEKGVAYLELKAAYGMAQRMASSEGQVLSVGDRTLWRRLHEAGLLAKHDKDRNTCSKRIGERPRKTIAITLDQLLPSYDAAKSGTTGTVGTGVPEAADSLGPVPDLRSRHKGTGNGNRSEADRGFQVDGSRCSQCPRSPETKEAEIERGFM